MGKTTIISIMAGICSVISYYIGLYVGMMKAKKIAKKVYREFGIFLPDEIKKNVK